MPADISIITPCLNGAAFIAEAIESVIAQTACPVEHIVVDGGSRDASRDIVARYPQVQWLAAPGSGIYTAINRGIASVEGGVIGLLNCDDRYPDGVFAEALRVFGEHPQADLVSGCALAFESCGDRPERIVEVHRDRSKIALTVRNAMLEVPIINARFFKRRVFEALGGFSPDYALTADRDLLLRAALAGMRDVIVPADFYRYRLHPLSLTINRAKAGARRLADENLRMAEHYAASNPEYARLCRRWHTASALTGAAAAARSADFGAALQYGRRMRAANPSYWRDLPCVIASKMIRRVQRSRRY